MGVQNFSYPLFFFTISMFIYNPQIKLFPVRKYQYNALFKTKQTL